MDRRLTEKRYKKEGELEPVGRNEAKKERGNQINAHK
jgi:hypothetical protein